jgi:hypothetical protein
MSEPEYTGNDVSYYLVKIESPKRLEPYEAECEDIIEALGMTFAEGCAFKAIWRKCAARTLGIAKAGYKGGLYDAEKAHYYGARMVADELRLEALTRTAPHAQPVPSPRTADTMPATFGQHEAMVQLLADGIASGDIGKRLGEPSIARMADDFSQQNVFEPASEIDDESDRQKAIEQNGNTGEHYAELEKLERWKGAPEWAKWTAQDANGQWWWYERKPIPKVYSFEAASGNSKSKLARIADKPKDFAATLESRPCAN